MQKRDYSKVAYVALTLVATAGVLTAILVAPGLGAALKLIDPNPRKAAKKLDRGFGRLVKQGKIMKTKEGYRLASTGQKELVRGAFDRYRFPPLKKWDGKWRVVCFDIPEKRKYIRRLLHSKLVELGFYRLQDSVFVGPHPCGEFLKLAHDAFSLRKHTRGMVVTTIDDEGVLLKHFGLTR